MIDWSMCLYLNLDWLLHWGEPMLIKGCIQAPVRSSQLEIINQFLVMERLVTPVKVAVY